MKFLFEDNRQANILMLLKKGNTISIQLLAEKLSVSPRSIRNDIKILNDIFHKVAVLDTEQGICSLRIFDAEGFQSLYTRIIDTEDLMNSPIRRMDYIFGKLMRAMRPILTDDLAYEMNIGRTTLIKDLKKLRTRIKPYQCSIVGKTSKGLMLQGSELNIRNYVMENCYESIYGDYPEDEIVRQAMDAAFLHHPFELSVQRSIRQYFTFMTDRFLTGHYIGRLQDSYYALTARNGFVFVDRLVNRIGNLLHVEFPIEEKIYVLLPIIGMRTPSDTNEMYTIELDAEIGPLLKKIIVRIQDELNLTIKTDEFTDEFMYHLMFMINRLRYGIHIDNPLIEEISNKYPLASQMAVIASQVVEDSCDVIVSNEEKGFLATYFSVFIETYNLQIKPDKIAVICGSGIVTSKLIEVQLKKIIDSHTTLDIYSLPDVTKALLDTYDIILSTIDLPFELHTPVIYIQEIFDESKLYSKLTKARYWKPSEIAVDDNWYTITRQLEEDYFFDVSDYTTYESALEFMVDCMSEDDKVDDAFEQRLREREKKGSMVFDRGVAMPHTIQTANNDISIAIGVFHKAISFHDTPVRLIILIALPENLSTKQDQLLIRIYDEIMTIVKDEELINLITQSTNYADFLRILYKRI